MSIALKEANEVNYWLELLYKTTFIELETFQKFEIKSTEILRLLVSIVKSAKK